MDFSKLEYISKNIEKEFENAIQRLNNISEILNNNSLARQEDLKTKEGEKKYDKGNTIHGSQERQEDAH